MNEKLMEFTMQIHQFNKEIMELNIKYCEEIERLKYIINEFDKLIENEINRSKLEDNYTRVDVLEYCLATLKELKGSEKE